jgi:hypothetical protein
MTTLLLALVVVIMADGMHGTAGPAVADTPASMQERRPVPSDSVEIEARGCLKGRVFTGTGQPAEERTSKGPDVTGKSFRVSGDKEVMDLVKKYNNQYVEVLGIVRKAALDDQGIGMRVGRGRVVIGAPGSDPTRMNTPAAAPSVPVMDLIAVRLLADRCPLQ